MRHASLLIALSAVSLIACSKTEEEAPAPSVPPAAEAPAPAAPAPLPPSESTAPAAPERAAPTAEPPAPASKAPPAPASPKSAAPTPPAAPSPPAAPAAAASTPAAGDLAHGEAVYRRACAFCHDKGAAGAPKLGDAATWAPRIAQGMDTLYASSLHGKRAMPAKGGNPSLSDADVKAAVDYLVARSR